MSEEGGDFSAAEIERARRYHRPLYAAFAIDVSLSLATAATLAFGTPGDELAAALETLPWWGVALVLGAAVVAGTWIVRLPLAFWRGYLREHRYGFSTQSSGGWLVDRLKVLALGLLLTAVPICALVGVARAYPGAWPAVAAPGAAGLVVLLGFVAPVVLEPLFNRFRPLDDAALSKRLRDLSIEAGVPVREVLVADASRRTRKQNAYVSGLGRTRRVVIYDTLLEHGAPAEIALIAAHELAHRREAHIAKGVVLGAAASAGGMLVLWGLLSWPALLAAIGATGAGDPRIVPFVVLAFGTMELLSLPAYAALSRRWERLADAGALELTGDVRAFEDSFASLARANLSDLDPPRFVYAVLFTHPTTPERIRAARAWAAARTV
jgi:STE24 endopeptidase